MASTNKTTHYELSQYVGSDKPTYLVDYNMDMYNIDNGIYNAQSKADVNEGSIGTLSNLTTTEKSNLVGAINEIDAQVGTNTSNIATNTLDISTNSTAIGDLTTLTTTAKTDLVSAVNEVQSETDTNTSNIGLLSNLTTTDKTNVVSAINEVNGVSSNNATNIGDLTNLNTTAKNNLVSAINEINNATELYYNASGSNSSIVLNDDVSNYSYLEILFKDNDNYIFNSGKVIPNSNGYINLYCINSGTNNVYYKSRSIVCSGTSISTNGNYYGEANATSNTFYHNNNIYIIKVIGYK